MLTRVFETFFKILIFMKFCIINVLKIEIFNFFMIFLFYFRILKECHKELVNKIFKGYSLTKTHDFIQS